MLCFTFAVAASTRGGTSLAPLSIGAMLMSMIYMGAATSGAHYNIAITLAVLLRTLFGATQDRFGAKAATSYIAVQLAGCICGSFVAVVVVGEEHQIGYPAVPAESTGDDGEVVSATDGSRIESPRASALVAEMLATFILVYVVLNVTTVTQLAGNSYFGIAIGMTVTAMGSAFGSVSGGALNPCIGLMGVVTGGGGGDVGDVWIYWVGPITGAIVGTLVFRLMNYEEFHEHPGESKFMAHVAVTDTRDQKYCAHAHNATHPPPPPSPSVPLWSNARPEESADDITDVSRTIPERDTGTATAPQPSEQPTEEI
jgi:aquaporin Z